MNTALNINPIASEHSKGQGANGIDAWMFAYLILIDTANTSTQATLIKAKQLQNNANAQEKLDNEESKLEWHHIPKQVVDHHQKVTRHTYFTSSFPFVSYSINVHKWNTYPNAGAVKQAMMQNQEQMSIRQRIASELVVLQQEAKSQSQDIEVKADGITQVYQEDSSIVHMIQTLSYAVNFTHPKA